MVWRIKQTTKHFDVLEIVQGVYVAVAKDATGAMANSGVVDLGESLLVFDSFNTQQAASELRTVIASVTGKRVSHLINSHWHGDHIRGNQVFRDVVIVSSERTRDIMRDVHPDRIREQRERLQEITNYIHALEGERSQTKDEAKKVQLARQVAIFKELETSLPTLELILPSETFKSDWYWHGTDRQVECHTFGAGHTACDSFLYIPDGKVCFVGDLVAIENHMLIVDGDIHHWILVLDKLSRFDIDYVVPGHGPVGGREWITKARDYLSHLLENVTDLRSKGLTGEDSPSVTVPYKYREWAAQEIYIKNVKYLLDRSQND